jgi:hypothetical protein
VLPVRGEVYGGNQRVDELTTDFTDKNRMARKEEWFLLPGKCDIRVIVLFSVKSVVREAAWLADLHASTNEKGLE